MAVSADGAAGFHRHRSNDVVAVDACPQTVPGALDGVVGAVWNRGSELQIVRDGAGEQHVVELRAVPRPQRGRRKPRPTVHRVRGSGVAAERIGDREWAVTATGFWQGHVGAAAVYSQAVADFARTPQGGTAWDLYSGAGLFTVVFAEQVGVDGTVVAVESSRAAAADGVAALADLPQASFRSAQVEQELGRAADTGGRGGARPAAQRRRAALGRDVALFAGLGYALSGLRAFDAFPMTQHVECIALFEP